MPRKQNGWGNSKSLNFKGFGRTDIGKAQGSPGSYPSNRQFGSSVTRTVIEKFNLDSDWVKWRKGYEYSVKAAWYKLQAYDPITQENSERQIQSKLYQGTANEVDVVFDGYRFATKNSDSANHYVAKRLVTSDVKLGKITKVFNDELAYPEQKKFREIWCQGQAQANSRLLGRMIGDRVTDGETEATLKQVLTSDNKPALYIGKSFDNPTVVEVTINKSDLTTDLQNYQELEGKIVYIPEFYTEKAPSDVDSIEFVDDVFFVEVNVEDTVTASDIEILDPGVTPIPQSLYDISLLPKIATATSGESKLKGTYLYSKDQYQRFYGRQNIAADAVAAQIELVSYTVLPFTVRGVDDTGDKITLISVPFDSEFRLAAEIGLTPTIVFTDWSFTKTRIDEYDGIYYHKEDPKNPAVWRLVDTDVNPWMDEVFTSGNDLKPAVIYTCSCPNHSQAQLRMPQPTEDEGTRKINRQLQYPLPSVLGKKDYDALASNKAAGRYTSWESMEHKFGFKLCKHTIAAMFLDKVKIKEPSKVPTIDARIDFEKKLEIEMNEVAEKFNKSYERGEITVIEIVFALAQGLNLDDVETAYVILNSEF